MRVEATTALDEGAKMMGAEGKGDGQCDCDYAVSLEPWLIGALEARMEKDRPQKGMYPDADSNTLARSALAARHCQPSFSPASSL